MEDPKMMEKWREFQHAAVLRLHTEALRHTESTCVFQFCRTPTLDACVYWSMFKDHRKAPGEFGRCFAVKGKWDKRADLERWHELWHYRPQDLQSMQPAVEHEVARLKLEAMEAFLAEINVLRIPPFCTDGPFGLDGIAYAFSMKSGFTTVDFAWWEQGPAEWRPMIDCVQTFAARLESQPRTQLTVAHE